MEQGETAHEEQAAPAEKPVPVATDPTPEPPAAAGSAPVSGIETNTGNIQPDPEKQNKITKPTVDLNFANCGSSANLPELVLNGAEDQLKNNPANRNGAGMATPYPSGGVCLLGHSESVPFPL
jgi:hypothetical protein